MVGHESHEAKDISLIELRSAPPGQATPESIKTEAKPAVRHFARAGFERGRGAVA